MFFRTPRVSAWRSIRAGRPMGKSYILGTHHRLSPGTTTAFPVGEHPPQTWLDLSERDGRSLQLMGDDPVMRSQLHQPEIAGVLLNLDCERSALEQWANLCLAAGKRCFVRIPASGASFERQRQGLAWRIKRLSDWLAAVVLLLILSPLLLALATLVKLSSPGPVFFRQWRVGEHGELFRIFKFRTMDAGAERRHHLVMGQQQGLNKCQHDPRVTWCGRWMRKSSLDELPQLLNVLLGQMSLVGPRPWALYDAVQLRLGDRHRLHALPGITGLWQISGRSQLLDIDRVTGLDLQYIQTWSLQNDLKILLLTFPSVIQGRGAC